MKSTIEWLPAKHMESYAENVLLLLDDGCVTAGHDGKQWLSVRGWPIMNVTHYARFPRTVERDIPSLNHNHPYHQFGVWTKDNYPKSVAMLDDLMNAGKINGWWQIRDQVDTRPGHKTETEIEGRVSDLERNLAGLKNNLRSILRIVGIPLDI